jgi:hypothetical protein
MTVRIPEDLLDELRAIARAGGVGHADLVRITLFELVDNARRRRFPR